MMTRQEFRLISMFIYLVIDALDGVVKSSSPSYQKWLDHQEKFINALGEYGRGNVPKK